MSGGNPNHDARGRFSGGSDSSGPGERFTSDVEHDNGEVHGVDADSSRYEEQDEADHDAGLAQADASFEDLYDSLDGAKSEVGKDAPSSDTLRGHADDIDGHVTRINEGLDQANAVREQYGDGEVGLHDMDADALSDATGIADSLRAHADSHDELKTNLAGYGKATNKAADRHQKGAQAVIQTKSTGRHQRDKAGDLVRKSFGADLDTAGVGERQVRVRVSTETADRTGDVVVQKGIGLDNFLKSRTVLWNHDQDHPIARCEDIGVKAQGVEALVQFPEPGVSAKADEVYGLIKAGVINAASIGFVPFDAEPADGKSPRKGLRIPRSDLMEFSFVSVPANSGAEVLQRAFAGGAVEGKPLLSIKGLCAVASLARLLESLGYQVDLAAAERARENDGSDVPEQLREVLGKLGAALVAMTTEEVAELLAGKDDDGPGIIDDGGPMFYAMAKAGRRFSAATRATMTKHLDAIGAAHGAMCGMLDDDGTSDDGDGPGGVDAMEKRLFALRLPKPLAV